MANAVSNGLCKNLYDIPGLNLNEPWWNQSVVTEASLGKSGDSLYYDASLTYGWTADLASSVRNAIIAGDSNVSSMIASQKDSVAAKIALQWKIS